jgi:hypothetical protein
VFVIVCTVDTGAAPQAPPAEPPPAEPPPEAGVLGFGANIVKVEKLFVVKEHIPLATLQSDIYE